MAEKPGRIPCGERPEGRLHHGSRPRAIVFDLDGTLYVSDEFAASIRDAAVEYLALVLNGDREQARAAVAEARGRLATETGAPPTLSTVCRTLGGTLSDMHAFFQQRLRPEAYLERDQRVVDLLDELRNCCQLYIYTNNSRPMANRILALLGLEGYFRVFAIDDSWRAKPDQATLERVLAGVGEPAGRVLFVGDRYGVDLQLPQSNGCPVLLTRSVEELLQLRRLILDRPG